MTPESCAVLDRMRAILSEPWSGEAGLEAVARAIVPTFAEWCVLDTRGADPNKTASMVVAHANARDEESLRQALERLALHERLFEPSLGAFHERRRVLGRCRVPGARAGEEAAVLALPLLSRGRLVGVLTLGRVHAFEPSDVESAEEIASRCAMAIDLAREARRVERTRESRDDMVSVLAHDLRTPLSTLSMVTSRLKKNRAVLEAATSETQVLTRSVARIEGLLRSLVDCTRLESGNLRMQAERCELAAIIATAVEAIRATAGERAVHFEKPDNASFDVIGDAARLRQVVDQLLSNAVKFTPDRGAVIARIEKSAHEVIVSVSDSGSGISPDKTEAIFVPSWEVPAEERTSGQGPRLGLYVARGVVEAQGGRLWVESAPGQGSTFSFSLPRADAEANAGAANAVRPILVVDDDADFRHAVADCLRGNGFAVVGAPHGRAGLDYLRTHELPALVLLDLTMPVMDGWELFRTIKADPALATVPIVVVSGLSRTPGERATIEGVEYLQKPLRPERLVELAGAHARPMVASGGGGDASSPKESTVP